MADKEKVNGRRAENRSMRSSSLQKRKRQLEDDEMLQPLNDKKNRLPSPLKTED